MVSGRLKPTRLVKVGSQFPTKFVSAVCSLEELQRMAPWINARLKAVASRSDPEAARHIRDEAKTQRKMDQDDYWVLTRGNN